MLKIGKEEAMMISPEGYIEPMKQYSYEQLIKERDQLIREIHKFEKNRDKEKKRKKLRSEVVIIDPSPEVVYQCNNQYLIKITELIQEKFKEL